MGFFNEWNKGANSDASSSGKGEAIYRENIGSKLNPAVTMKSDPTENVPYFQQNSFTVRYISSVLITHHNSILNKKLTCPQELMYSQ